MVKRSISYFLQQHCKFYENTVISLSITNKKTALILIGAAMLIWLRGVDLNHQPSGYGPDELPLLYPAASVVMIAPKIALTSTFNRKSAFGRP